MKNIETQLKKFNSLFFVLVISVCEGHANDHIEEIQVEEIEKG